MNDEVIILAEVDKVIEVLPEAFFLKTKSDAYPHIISLPDPVTLDLVKEVLFKALRKSLAFNQRYVFKIEPPPRFSLS